MHWLEYFERLSFLIKLAPRLLIPDTFLVNRPPRRLKQNDFWSWHYELSPYLQSRTYCVLLVFSWMSRPGRTEDVVLSGRVWGSVWCHQYRGQQVTVWRTASQHSTKMGQSTTLKIQLCRQQRFLQHWHWYFVQNSHHIKKNLSLETEL